MTLKVSFTLHTFMFLWELMMIMFTNLIFYEQISFCIPVKKLSLSSSFCIHYMTSKIISPPRKFPHKTIDNNHEMLMMILGKIIKNNHTNFEERVTKGLSIFFLLRFEQKQIFFLSRVRETTEKKWNWDHYTWTTENSTSIIQSCSK